MAKDELIRFRVTNEEKLLIEQAAKGQDISVSAWIVVTLVEAARPGVLNKAAQDLVDPVAPLVAARRKARHMAAEKGLPEPTFKGPAEGHAPSCQCLSCRQERSSSVEIEGAITPRCSKHKYLVPCPRCS